MNRNLKTCSCGKIIAFNSTCSCKAKANRNEYQKGYYERNKETTKPLNSVRWRKLRTVIIQRDNSCCQRCLVKYGRVNGYKLQVHHIKPRIECPQLMFEESNLISLCQTCNLQLGTKDKLDFEWKPDNVDFSL